MNTHTPLIYSPNIAHWLRVISGFRILSINYHTLIAAAIDIMEYLASGIPQ
jgi:hypothetical protein